MISAPVTNGLSGPQLFARYAYPPNAKGYCGPEDADAVWGMIRSPDAGPDLRAWAGNFDGAWPYLTFIASVTGIGDPLDRRVVEAYWLGTDLLQSVPLLDFGNSLRDRFRDRNPTGWSRLSDALPAGAVPHHSFHVFCVYPWVGLLREGHVGPALEVLDRCRIRSGTVASVHEDVAIVETHKLTYTDGILSNHQPTQLPFSCEPGVFDVADVVSLHWDWACDVLTVQQARQLARTEAEHLRLANTAHLVA